MRAFGNAWNKHRTARRLSKLWKEYKEAAEFGNTQGILEKLKAFLDSFETAYTEFKKDGDGKAPQLDRFYGDCKEMLVGLLDAVDRGSQLVEGSGEGAGGDGEQGKTGNKLSAADRRRVDEQIAALVDKAIAVAELIVRDEKYRDFLKETPELLDRVLAMLDHSKLQSTEARKMALKLIISVGQSSHGKLEIGRQQGFRKMLTLLLDGDPELTHDAIKALQHFLYVQQLEMGDEEDAPPKLKSAISSIGSVAGYVNERLPSVIWGLSKAVLGELNHITQGTEGGGNGVEGGEGAVHSDDQGTTGTDDAGEFPPSRRALAQTLEELQLSQLQGTQLDESGTLSPSPTDGFVHPDYSGDGSNSAVVAGGEDNLIKEFMRMQGALRTLTSMLSQAAQELQIELLETLRQLLSNSRQSQMDFKLMDGYSLVLKVFDGITEYESPETLEFVSRFFRIIFMTVLDGDHRTHSVHNLDALTALFKLTCKDCGCHIVVRLGAIQCLADILCVNPLNVMSYRRVGGLDTLLVAFDELTLAPGEMQLLDALNGLFLYCAFLLSRHDCDLIDSAVTLAATSLRLNHTVRSRMIETTARLLRHRSSRHLPQPSTGTLTHFLKMLGADGACASLYQEGGDVPAEAGAEEWLQKPPPLQQSEAAQLACWLMECLALSCTVLDNQPSVFADIGAFGVVMALCGGTSHPLVVSTGLWLVTEVVVHSAPTDDLSEHAVNLVTVSGWPAGKRLQVMRQLTRCLRELVGERGAVVRRRLMERGLDARLIHTFKRAGPAVATEAFMALGALVMGCNESKKALCQSPGCVQLSQLIIQSSVNIRKEVMEILLQLAAAQPEIKPALLTDPWAWPMTPADQFIRLLSRRVRAPLSGTAVDAPLHPQPPLAEAAAVLEQAFERSTDRGNGGDSTPRQSQITPRGDGGGSGHITPGSDRRHYERAGGAVGDSSVSDPIPIGARTNDDSLSRPVAMGGSYNSHTSDRSVDSHPESTDANNSALRSRAAKTQFMPDQIDVDGSGVGGGGGEFTAADATCEARETTAIASPRGVAEGVVRLGALLGTSLTVDDPTVLACMKADCGKKRRSGRGRRHRYHTDSEGCEHCGSLVAVLSHQSRITHYQFRSTDAALMLLNVLPKADVAVQREVFAVLFPILEANPSNLRMLCKMQGLTVILSSVNQCHDEVMDHYMHLVAALGQYDIQPEEARLLFELACADDEAVASGVPSSPGMPALGSPDVYGKRRPKKSRRDIVQELRMQFMFVIGRISERTTPPHYFHFSGRGGQLRFAPIPSFPPLRTGYTMSCWFRVTQFLGDEINFLRWVDTSGPSVIELFLQSLGAEQDSRCLSVRNREGTIDDDGGETPFNAFNALSVFPDGVWRHLVLTHAYKTLSFFCDGQFVQSCSFMTYPSAVSKDHPLLGFLGGGGGHAAGFCGEVGAVSFSEGVWDGGLVRKVWEQGPFLDDPTATIKAYPNSEHKGILLVHPQACAVTRDTTRADLSAADREELIGMGQHALDTEEQPSKLHPSASPAKPPSKAAARERGGSLDDATRRRSLSKQRSPGPKGLSTDFEPDYDTFADGSNKITAELDGWVQAHATRSLQDVIREVGGVHIALPLLSLGASAQVAGLQILAGLLVRSAANRADFESLGGYSVLWHLLHDKPLTQEHFDVLLDIAAHGDRRPHKPLRNVGAVLLCADLIQAAPLAVQTHTLRMFEDSIMSFPESAQLWLTTEGLGVDRVIGWLTSIDTALKPVLLGLLHQLAPSFGSEAVDDILAFACTLPVDDSTRSSIERRGSLDSRGSHGSNTDTNTNTNIGPGAAMHDARAQLLDLLLERMASGASPVELLRAAGGGGYAGWDVAFSLVDHESEPIRVGGIKAIGLLLWDGGAKAHQTFAKMSGFEILKALLSQRPAGIETCTTLLKLAIGRFERNVKPTTVAASSSKGVGSKDVPVAAVPTPLAAGTLPAGPKEAAANDGNDSECFVVTGAVQTLFGILAADASSPFCDMRLHAKVLSQIAALLARSTPSTLSMLDAGGLDWCRELWSAHRARLTGMRAATCSATRRSLDDTTIGGSSHDSHDKTELESVAEIASGAGGAGDKPTPLQEEDAALIPSPSAAVAPALPVAVENMHGTGASPSAAIAAIPILSPRNPLTPSSASHAAVLQSLSSAASPLDNSDRELGGAHIEGLLRDVVRELMVADILRSGKLNTRWPALKIRDVVEDSEQYLFGCIEEALRHLDAYPVLVAAEAAGTLRALVSLLELLLEAHPPPPPALFIRAVTTINRITNRNTSGVRTRMKEVSLLDMRDTLLLHSLRLPHTAETATQVITGFRFDWVAGQARFIEEHGILVLLHMMHSFSDDHMLCTRVATVLRHAFGPVDACRKAIGKVLENDAVLQRLCGDGDEQANAPDGVTPGAIAFTTWYFQSPEQRAVRESIENRIFKLKTPVDTTVRKAMDRLATKRQKRQRDHSSKVSKSSGSIAKVVGEWVDRCLSRTSKCNARMSKAIQQGEARLDKRRTEGLARWAMVEAEMHAREAQRTVLQSQCHASAQSSVGTPTGKRSKGSEPVSPTGSRHFVS